MQIVKKTKDEGNVIIGYKCDDCEKLSISDSLPSDWFKSHESIENTHYCEDCKMENVEYWKTEYFTLVDGLKNFIEKHENKF